MTRPDWRPGVVTLLDLIGVKKKAASGQGSTLMRQMHAFVRARCDNGLPRHSHAYLWNDSVLLLAFLGDEPGEKDAIIREADALKRDLDADLGLPSYGIVVQGEIFPEDLIASPVFDGQIAAGQRTTTIKASSYAMANCFIIEEQLSKNKQSWYIDSRVAKYLTTTKPAKKAKVALLPMNRGRDVWMYSGALW